ncbi:hypothetical protein EIN_185760 [Entamoeba invadens IP1]|uniref:hypothetical protein n=1 Tax=Entamoeba invadens IP1 TaxID=370355 RepID=UPI0002C3F6DB|nr:hypothetical protein EIN_185760 [Entamoeba invadens IP1]ELP94169.1 hypothetical protein EIN_185760 [Entamoeba invadens IP1]|eukprot:XP_004260940.1 hypothetical protein EIN_185760 [Entamoeba invadens IP1]
MSKPQFRDSDSTPISREITSKQLQLCLCPLCLNGIPPCADTKTQLVSWIHIIRIILYSLNKLRPNTEYFTLKKDIYGYVAEHWYIFSTLKQFVTSPTKWKKSFLDALSHSPYFESGYNAFKTTGYWKLRILDNPWAPEVSVPPVNVAYSKEEAIHYSTGPTIVMDSFGEKRAVENKDNFYEIQMRLRDSYIKTFDYAQSMLEQSDIDLQRNIGYDQKMVLLSNVETLKNLKMGMYFLMKALNENEASYKQTQKGDNHFSGCLFFNVVMK